MLERVLHPDGVVTYRSPLLAGVGVPHAFSTRIGGVSAGAFDSLNLGNPNGCPVQDDEANIRQNYARLMHAAGCVDRMRCWTHQVHGADVVLADDSFDCSVKADALVTRDRRKLLSIRVADCVPVLMSTRDGVVVGAAHAGWRGVVVGVVTRTLLRLIELAPSNRPADVVVAIGPSIGPDSFEVGPDVVIEFTRAFPDHPELVRPLAGDKSTIDLRGAIALQLQHVGVALAHIDSTDRCTFRDRDEFFSHRRERGMTGRMAALVAPR